MRYFVTSAYEEHIKALSDQRKKRVQRAIRLAIAFFETGDLPQGLGMKPLKYGIWEIRAGLSDRALFRKNKDVIEFIMVGTHDEIRRFLKNQ